jgi:hypothetical protein
VAALRPPASTWPRLRCYARTLAAVAILVVPGAAGAGEVDLEAAVKANYLYKFTPFVTWPLSAFANATSPFNLCVMGADPFGGALDTAVRGGRVAGHPVVVRHMGRPDDLTACHLLYAAGGRGPGPSDALQALARRPVLTVSDEGPGAPATIIRFVLLQGRVRFSVDAVAAQNAGLTISSKLLQLAVARPVGRS